LLDFLGMGLRNKLKRGLKDPSAAYRYVFGGRDAVAALDRERFFKAITGQPTVSGYVADLQSDKAFAARLANPMMKAELERGPGPIPLPVGELLYVLCRYMKPSVVVETGVGHGTSSAFILAALRDNGRGQLHSIDYPNATYTGDHREVHDVLPSDVQTGWFVPENLRERWTLHLGRTQEILGPLLTQLEVVDIFLRDSEHVYSTMMFEFRTAWSHMGSGSLLLSDNVGVNSAFEDFCKEMRPLRTSRYLDMAAALKD
jgi:hypothetical protein